MFKVLTDYESSLKHFRLALNDSSPCSQSSHELRFHIAHVYELQGKFKTTKEAYEQILESADLPNVVKANTLRQLGWMYHTVDTLGEIPARESYAIQYLQRSVEVDPTSGQTWYFLGRCFSSIGKVHDAFMSYRQSIDKSEASADTWCSIGVLYQQQSQPMDALQAYICAVQLDKSHTAAWTDLGILYESCNQPKDALTCYLNAAKNTKAALSSSLTTRIKVLKQQLAALPPQYFQNKQKTLPSIEEAWSLPIPAELTSRQGASNQARANLMGAQQQQQRHMIYPQPGAAQGGQLLNAQGLQYPPVVPGNQTSMNSQDGSTESQAKRQKTGKKGTETPPPPPFYLSNQQLQMLNYLQQNQAQLTQQQQQIMQDLHQRYVLQQQHQQVIKMQQQQMQENPVPAQPGPQLPHQMPGHPPQQGPGHPPHGQAPHGQAPHGQAPHSQAPHGQAPHGQATHGQASHGQTPPGHAPVHGPPPPQFPGMPPNIPELPSVLPTSQGPAGLLGHPAGGVLPPDILDTILPKDLQHPVTDQELTALLSRQDIATSLAEDLLKQFTHHAPHLTQPPHDNTSQDKSKAKTLQTIPKVETIDTDVKLELTVDTVLGVKQNRCTLQPPGNFSINMSNAQILAAVQGTDKINLNSSCIMSENPPPCPPDPPYPPLLKEKLNPPTPSVYLESKKDAFSLQLQQYCLSQPVCVIRGLAGALKLDLGLFSTKSLVEANPDHLIEMRSQIQQSPDENRDEFGNIVWKCGSSRSHTTIAKYAQYQASSFQESLKEEAEKSKGTWKEKDSDSDSNSSAPKGKRKIKMIKFGTNVDLSDEKKWKPQLHELTKLPAFARVVSASNMLSHIGHTILGMNSVQLYMKVPGSRTPGHQENHDFCSVNVNIGPGDCEWFATPEPYWGVFHRLCEKNMINYLKGAWWPMLEDLYEHNVPVYRFIQKPGDLVWVGAGAVHWVQAIGWCNNIAWNVGPLTWKTYQLACERYEYNKVAMYKSIVPLCHLSFNLARNVKVTDPKLYEQMRYTLLRSIKRSHAIFEFLRELGKDVRWHGRTEEEIAHYCNNCEVEVFNLLFIVEQDKKFVVHCLDCALKINCKLENFVILEQFKMDELIAVCDNFQLGTVSQISTLQHAS